MRILLFMFLFLAFPSTVGASGPLTYHYREQQFTLNPAEFPFWRTREERLLLASQEFSLPPSAKVCREDDAEPPLPKNVRRERREAWNPVSIAATIKERISATLEREAGSVQIFRTDRGAVEFEGNGLPGRRLDTDAAVELTIAALEQGIADIVLPVIETPPRITVDDSNLREQGIREVFAIGESDFSGSPQNRRHNILLGLTRLNGALIVPRGTFSFTSTLGPVSEETGYKKELVILGEKTLPEFGGGLCQLSTTVYRAAWLGGLPIVERRNHSFAVSYYSPPGTDATVYPPYTDFRFANDSPGLLLLQTFALNDRAYAILYGTRDGRESDVYGPYISDRKEPPPDRLEETMELSPGERKKLSERREGLSALWYRVVRRNDEEPSFEAVRSVYEPRALWEQVGVRAEDEEDKEEVEDEEERST